MTEATPAPAKLIEPGIYFGMPEDVYHLDPALGSTSIKELVLDPIEYQHERLFGADKKETFALKWGSAIHCRALEGRQSLADRFPIEPSQADYEGLLVSYDDLKKACSKLGVSPGKTKAEAIGKIREFDKDVPIWDEIKAVFDKEANGRTTIPKDAVQHIERAVSWMQQDPYLSPVMEDGTITAGASEVSIFYEDRGVRLKARIDHLLAHAVLDLKSFRPIFAERVKPAARKAIERMRYDLQAADYIRALRFAKGLWENGQVFNNPYPPIFLETVFSSLDALEDGSAPADTQLKWIWVLIKASGAPQPIIREFDLNSMIFRNAASEVEDAIDAYREYVETFGLDREWVPSIVPEKLGDQDFSPYAFL